MAAWTSHVVLASAVYKLDMPDNFFNVKGYKDVKLFYQAMESDYPANQDSEETPENFKFQFQDAGIILHSKLMFWENWPYDVQPSPNYHFGQGVTKMGQINSLVMSGESVVGTNGNIQWERMKLNTENNLMLPFDEEAICEFYLSAHNGHATQAGQIHLWSWIFYLSTK